MTHSSMFLVFWFGAFAIAHASHSSKPYSYTLMENLAKQSETLSHGFKIASRMGNLGAFGSHGRIAFAAYCTSNNIATTTKYAQFKTVVTNIGNAYSPSTSTFKAPYNGVYIIAFTIGSYSSSYTGNDPAIVVNGSVKIKTWCYNYSSYTSPCSITVPLDLKRGDVVGIRSAGGKVFVHHTHSSFSGWMM